MFSAYLMFFEAGPSIPVVIDCGRINNTDFTAAKGFKSMLGDFESRFGI